MHSEQAPHTRTSTTAPSLQAKSVVRSTTTTSGSPSNETTSLSGANLAPGRPPSGILGSMTVIRRGGQLDVPFMRSLLTHAYNWHVNVLETEVPIGRYVDGWGRPGDTALLAVERGHRIGAGWFRLFRESAPGYGFVDELTPELTVVVVPSRQGEGIGQLLLAGLVDRAQAEAYRALSFSVEEANPEVDVYAAAGFEQVGASGRAVTMRRTFA
jgi:GNAT superfamily N-acetyltransferase